MMLRNRVSSSTHSAWFITSLAVLFAILEAASPAAQATEIKVFSLPGLGGAFKEIAPTFENTTGHKLLFTFEVNAPIMRRIDSGLVAVDASGERVIGDYLFNHSRYGPGR